MDKYNLPKDLVTQEDIGESNSQSQFATGRDPNPSVEKIDKDDDTSRTSDKSV